jgi:hypothetical protein
MDRHVQLASRKDREGAAANKAMRERGCTGKTRGNRTRSAIGSQHLGGEPPTRVQIVEAVQERGEIGYASRRPRMVVRSGLRAVRPLGGHEQGGFVAKRERWVESGSGEEGSGKRRGF